MLLHDSPQQPRRERPRVAGCPRFPRSVEFGAIRIYRLVDGLVVETWAHQGSMELARRLRG